MSIKRIAGIVLILTLVLVTLCACDESEVSSDTTPTTTPTTTTTATAVVTDYDGEPLIFPEYISISGCYDGTGYTITAYDEHTLLFELEGVQTMVPLTAEQVSKLNTLYTSITDYSEDPAFSSTERVYIRHDGVTDAFSYGLANSAALNHFMETVFDLFDANGNPQKAAEIIWEVPSDTEITFFDSVTLQDGYSDVTITKHAADSLKYHYGDMEVVVILRPWDIYQFNALYRDLTFPPPTYAADATETATFVLDGEEYVVERYGGISEEWQSYIYELEKHVEDFTE